MNSNPYPMTDLASATLKRIAFIGNYPPRRCGIATFTRDLCEALATACPQVECSVAAMNDPLAAYDYPDRVQMQVEQDCLESYQNAVEQLNRQETDILCVQHEFGIFGGASGSYILDLLREATMPVVTTLHSVLRYPNGEQRRVMDELAKRSDRLVVMAQAGAAILREVYQIPDSKVVVIPHGIYDTEYGDGIQLKAKLGLEGRKVMLTFGLLSPGKGIEFVIEALPDIVREHPNVIYLILGATHPRLLADEGERYRQNLERYVAKIGMSDHVIFLNQFVSNDELTEFLGATDLYLTPYLNEDQITSGTLAYAFGAGNVVVSTPYIHASELLADGRGVLVPFRDAAKLASTVCELFHDPEKMVRMGRSAYADGRDMIWSATANRYVACFLDAISDHGKSPSGVVLENDENRATLVRMNHWLQRKRQAQRLG